MPNDALKDRKERAPARIDGPLLTRSEVFAVLRVGRTRGFEILRRTDFPQGLNLSDSARGTSVVYLLDEILAWARAQPRRSVGAEPEHLATGRQYRDGKFVGRPRRAVKRDQ